MIDAAPSVLRATWRSPAKVNLCLRIVGRRADGYHLLDSIFAAVDLCDRITVEVRDVRAGADSVIEVSCDHPAVPASASNLAARAAQALLHERGIAAHVTIGLEKHIPPGSGLGGGSGNAATVLSGLNALLDLAVPAARLREMALGLGADVAFFLSGGVARVRGIGEVVEPIRPAPDLHLVLAIPSFGVSTAWAFGAYAAAHLPFATGDAASLFGADGRPAAAELVNDLEGVVFAQHPALAALKRQVLAAGAEAAVMSGSGSVILGLAPSAPNAHAIAGRVAAANPAVVVRAVALYEAGSGAARELSPGRPVPDPNG